MRSWVWVAAIAAGVAAVLGYAAGLGAVDFSIRDLWGQIEASPPDPRIVLVGIDDASLSHIGRWPWPDGVHAAFLNRISDAQAAAVGFDFPLGTVERRTDGVLISDPTLIESLGAGMDVVKQGSDALAAAVKREGKVVVSTGTLDRTQFQSTLLQPAPAVAEALAGVGFSGYPTDADHRIRSLPLMAIDSTVPNSTLHTHFTLALAEVAGYHITPHGQRNPDILKPGSLQWDHWSGFPVSTRLGRYPLLSYVDILAGRVPPAELKGKIVLVGPTAKSITHFVAISGESISPMNSTYVAELELDAHLLSALLNRATVARLPRADIALISALLVLGGLLLLSYKKHRPVLTTGAMFAAVLAGSLLLYHFAGLWFPPTAALIGLAMIYPLSRWKRLEVAADELAVAFETMLNEPAMLAEAPPTLETRRRLDPLDIRLRLAFGVAKRVQALRHFIVDILENLPHATLIASPDGHVVLTNRRARTYFAGLNHTQLDGSQLPYLLDVFTAEDSGENFSWWNMIDTDIRDSTIRAMDNRGRDLVIRTSLCTGVDGEAVGWVTTITDITAIRVSERRRDEALHFMSHELCTPQTAILSILIAEGGLTENGPVEIEHHARQTLSLADKFVQLSLAESQEFEFSVCDVGQLVGEIVDDCRNDAIERDITIVFSRAPAPLLAEVDPDMLWRALSNLTANALRFCREHGTVTLTIDEREVSGEIVIQVADEGPGIAPFEQARMIRILQNINLPGMALQGGVGLGLSLVRVIAEKHRGRLEFTSNPGKGTEFRLVLPCGLEHIPAAAAVTKAEL